MAPEFAASAMLLGLLLLFLGFNLHNVVKGVRARRGKASGAEVQRPSGLWATLASIGTISFFVVATVYGFIGLFGYGDPIQTVLVPIPSLFEVMNALGLVLVAGGVLLFLWSVAARRRYSVSWEMPSTTGWSRGAPTGT